AAYWPVICGYVTGVFYIPGTDMLIVLPLVGTYPGWYGYTARIRANLDKPDVRYITAKIIYF
nr:hypothetical protein [Lachnospiraceae bacterium]